MKPHYYYSDLDLRDEAIERERERDEARLAYLEEQAYLAERAYLEEQAYLAERAYLEDERAYLEEQAYLEDERAGIHDQEDQADLGRYDEELT